ncbi:MAG: ParB/RepB/Spo0J family partition protein [Anaerolineae bacterium]|nr:ParB/RepB/Spo0J family partition protein [Anaerolineae bacterium]
MGQKAGLGRGLGALIPGADEANAQAQTGVVEIAIDDIRPNPRQPRLVRSLEALKLDELAASIREHGVIQPLIVTRTKGAGAPYTLIAGERRWRAAKQAGLTRVPALVKEATPQEMLELALIENLQRSDLSPLEEATAYQQLINEFGLTQEMVAARVGKSRVAITNTLRLLKLPGQVQAALMQGEISEGHARVLLALSTAVDQLAVLEAIKSRGLSVRQTEELVRRMTSAQPNPAKKSRSKAWPEARTYEKRLREVLGTKVLLQRSRKGGRLVIEFYSDEEFEALFERLTRGGLGQ